MELLDRRVLPAKVAVTEKLPAVAYVCVKVAYPVALVVLVSVLPSPYESVTAAPASGGVPVAPESIVTTKTAGSVAIGVSGSTVPLMDVEYLPILKLDRKIYARLILTYVSKGLRPCIAGWCHVGITGRQVEDYVHVLLEAKE